MTPESEGRPSLRRGAVVLGILVVLAAASVASTYSPFFQVKEIRVRTGKHLSTEAVLRIAGLDASTNVFHLDGDSVEAVLERHVWVADAVVIKDLPGGLEIQIRERVPVARWRSPSGSLVVTDEGVATRAHVARPLPRLEAYGGHPPLDVNDISAAAKVLAKFPSAVRNQIAVMKVRPLGEYELQLRGGVPVQFGGGTDAAEKGAALRALLRWVEKMRARPLELDVRVPTAPTATLPGTGSVPL